MTRYSRQVIVPEIGEEGQIKLRKAKVIVIGSGGLGSPILMYLTAAGIGHIRLVDYDVVSLSNLNRQVIHSTPRIGEKKTISAKKFLHDLNPEVDIDAINEKLTTSNALKLMEGYDYIIDASDNFKTKFLVNDTAVNLNTPATIGGVIRWDGQLMSIAPGQSACYRCVFSDEPPAGSMKPPSILGILGATAGVIGSIAAVEAIKFIIGLNDDKRLTNKLLMMDLRTVDFTIIKVKRNYECSCHL